MSPVAPIATALLLLVLAPPAVAGAAPPAWYQPDLVAEQSATFRAASAEIGPRYQAIEDELRRLSGPIEELSLGAALAGDALSADSRIYVGRTRTAAVAARIQAQKHVNLVQEDYGRAFGDALDRALGEVGRGYTVEECKGGGSMASMMGQGRSCPGEDLNAALARALDRDSVLAREIASVNAVPWPTVEVQGAPQPVLALTGDASWFQLGALAQAIWADRLEARSDDLDRLLAPLEDLIAAGDKAALSAATEHRAAYDSALAADGQVLLALVQATLEKNSKKGGADVGACVNPVALGGCPGQDRSAELIALLRADRRLTRGLAALPM